MQEIVVRRSALLLLALLLLATPLAALGQSGGQNNTLYLPMAISAGTPQQTDEWPNSGPTSFERIAEALAAGAIDAETALVFRVYAAFRDERLPSQYRGFDEDGANDGALAEAVQRMDSLSPATQTLLQPFTIPPIYQESWYGQRQTSAAQPATEPQYAGRCTPDPAWEYVDSALLPVRFWYDRSSIHAPGDLAAAQQNLTRLDTLVWPKLITQLGMRTPLGDSAEPCHGSDGRIDIYITPSTSQVVPLAPCLGSQQPTPGYMLFSRGSGQGTFAHEFMHLIQLAYPAQSCLEDENHWWAEATADWARHYVYGYGNHGEHTTARIYLNAPELPLDTEGKTHKGHDYGANVWAFFLQHQYDPKLIPAIWEALRDQPVLAAMDRVLAPQGGFAQAWPEFAHAAWNRDAVRDFQTWDGLTDGLALKRDEAVTLNGAPSSSLELDGAVKYLSTHAFRFTFPDTSVRSVALINRYGAADLATAHIEALVKIGGTWQRQDWTNVAVQPFCRDLRAERVEELVLLISNHEWQDRGHTLRAEDSPLLTFTNLGCRGWEVEATVTATRRGPNLAEDETVTTKATLLRHRPDPQAWIWEDYRVEQGTASWEFQGTKFTCSASGSGSYDVKDSGDPSVAFGTLKLQQYGAAFANGRFTATGERHYNALAATRAAAMARATYSCIPPEQVPLMHGAWLQTAPASAPETAGGAGQIIEGSETVTSSGGGTTVTIVWTWKMTALGAE